MSLKVWLPLNGTLVQQGISNFEAINNGATVNTSGKIGSCYAFNGSSNYIYAPYNFYNPQYSVCAWVYTNSTAATQTIVCDRTSTGLGFSIFLMNSGYMRLDAGGATNAIQWTTQYKYSANTWFHLTITYDGTYIAYYINGEFKEKLAKTINSTYWGNTTSIGASQANGSGYGNFLNGRLNDIRIYDHCLSAAEVKEISQGLVLHYKLDRTGPGFGNPNLLVDGMTPTAAGNGASGITRSIEDGVQKVVAASSNGNWCTFGNHNTTLTLTKGDTFTFSLLIKSPDSTKKPTVYFQSGLGYYSMQGNMSDEWSIIYYTGTWSIDNLQTNIHLGFSSAPGTYYIRYFKLEKGNQVTDWAPKSGEPLSELKYVYDSSGYKNNGTITGTVTIDSDTPRYSCSSYLNGSSYILTPAGSFAWNDLSQLTLSAWMKPTASVSGWTGSVGIATDTTYVARGIALTDYANTFRVTYTDGSYYQTVASGQTLNQNEWYHCAATLNGTILKLYLNGTLVKEETISWGTATLNSNARFEVGVDLPGSDEKFTGNYSDVRCYCTTLSANDILQLYHTGAKIDNKQNTHAFEFVEDQSATKITKQGQFKCEEIVEDTAAKLYNDNIIEAAEFIEF